MTLKRKKRKGGRPRKQNVPREANGRVSRTYAAASAYKAAIEARARIFGLSEKDASDQKAGTVVGRMALSGTISQDQYEAAQKYTEVRNAYLRAIYAKQDYKEPRPEVEGDGDYESFCRRAREIYDGMQDALRELCIEQRSPGPVSALDNFINRDVFLANLEGDLRLALNRLSRLFFEGRKKSVDRPMSETSHGVRNLIIENCA